MSAGALADLLIAAAMCYYLYRMRTGFERQAPSRPFDIYAIDLADVHTQNRFHNHDLDGLQYQFGFADKVSSSHTLTNDPQLTSAASLVSA